MATATLTPRQTEIRKHQKAGKSPTEIAELLGITDNAVYQQLRRMRTAAGKAPAKPKAKAKAKAKPAAKPARKPTSRRKTTRKTTGSSVRATPIASPTLAASTIKAPTPLQSIKARREEISGALHETQAAFDQAAKALEEAQAAHLKATEKHTDELRQLDLAERVLKGEMPKRAAAPRQRSNGKGDTKAAESAAQAATPPAAPVPAPEPAPEPAAETQAPSAPEPAVVAAAPDVQAAEQAAADAGQERPGAPTLPEFANEAEAAHAAAETGDGFEQPDVAFGESA